MSDRDILIEQSPTVIEQSCILSEFAKPATQFHLNIITHNTLILYKEITTLRDAQQLQEDLESLQLREGMWLLKFSIPKCYVLRCQDPSKPRLHTTIT